MQKKFQNNTIFSYNLDKINHLIVSSTVEKNKPLNCYKFSATMRTTQSRTSTAGTSTTLSGSTHWPSISSLGMKRTKKQRGQFDTLLQPKDYKVKMFQRRGDGGEGDLQVVWHFSHGENRRGATTVVYI
jgi:hypothetical protein